MSFSLNKIYVDEAVVDEEVTRRILKKCKSTMHEVVKCRVVEETIRRIPLTQGKRILYITKTQGELVKPCPGTVAPYLCCRYTIVNQTIQCPLDCTYCILQTYLDRAFITLHTNLSDTYRNVDRLLAEQPCRFFRFGTGELSDSLALDHITGLARDFACFFSTKRNALIELKTKTDCVEGLSDAPSKNVVLSWSLNPQEIVKTEEFLTAGVSDRLLAAQHCQEKGFLLGFHFDPILWVPGWESLYKEVIRQLFSAVDGSRIVWISLGSLRYPPPLKDIVQKRFPGTRVIYEEMVRGLDGKMRYPRPIRIEMYQKIYGWLKEMDPGLFIYFCMEPPSVWEKVMGTTPESNEELDFWFAKSLRERFPDLDMDEPRREAYVFD